MGVYEVLPGGSNGGRQRKDGAEVSRAQPSLLLRLRLGGGHLHGPLLAVAVCASWLVVPAARLTQARPPPFLLSCHVAA